MGESVNGIRGAFYSDIIYDYQCKYDDKREKSFLYRAFWAEGVSGLLKRLDRSLSEHLAGDGHESPNPLEKYMAPFCPNSRPGSWDYPWHLAKQPLKPGDESRIKEQLAAAMAEHPAWAKGLLTKTVPEKGRKERRDFWEELWLRDAAYRAGLITDTDYYLWLVEYLAVRDIYYKDNSIANAHLWLKRLLHKTGVAGEDLAVKANVEKKLAEAAALIRQERGAGGTEIAARLHNLKRSVKNRNGETIRKEDYLPWLTARLEQMALHIKIKTWLQDSGYPARGQEGARKSGKEPRKQDFSLRLFEAYCDSREGYEFCRKAQTGGEGSGVWHMEGQGFCVLDVTPQQADKLRESLEQDRERPPYLYIPLAIHTVSGCVFFLAGKENYRELYERAGKRPDAGKALKEAYEKAGTRYCFDYLRLDKKFREQFLGDVGGAFRLHPTFHKKQGKNYEEVLEDFKRYCKRGCDSPRRVVKNLNEEMEMPADIRNAFNWAFDNVEEMEVSLEAAASFNHTREMADREY